MSSTVDDRNLNPMIKIGNSHISILQNSYNTDAYN